jgi:hypothetical protein
MNGVIVPFGAIDIMVKVQCHCGQITWIGLINWPNGCRCARCGTDWIIVTAMFNAVQKIVDDARDDWKHGEDEEE